MRKTSCKAAVVGDDIIMTSVLLTDLRSSVMCCRIFFASCKWAFIECSVVVRVCVSLSVRGAGVGVRPCGACVGVAAAATRRTPRGHSGWWAT